MDDLLEEAWGVIANAGGGDWSKQTPEWREAATHWRDRYFQSVTDGPAQPSVDTIEELLLRRIANGESPAILVDFWRAQHQKLECVNLERHLFPKTETNSAE